MKLAKAKEHNHILLFMLFLATKKTKVYRNFRLLVLKLLYFVNSNYPNGTISPGRRSYFTHPKDEFHGTAAF